MKHTQPHHKSLSEKSGGNHQIAPRLPKQSPSMCAALRKANKRIEALENQHRVSQPRAGPQHLASASQDPKAPTSCLPMPRAIQFAHLSDKDGPYPGSKQCCTDEFPKCFTDYLQWLNFCADLEEAAWVSGVESCRILIIGSVIKPDATWDSSRDTVQRIPTVGS